MSKVILPSPNPQLQSVVFSFTLMGGFTSSFDARHTNFSVHVGDFFPFPFDLLLEVNCLPGLPKLKSLLCSAAAAAAVVVITLDAANAGLVCPTSVGHCAVPADKQMQIQITFYKTIFWVIDLRLAVDLIQN